MGYSIALSIFFLFFIFTSFAPTASFYGYRGHKCSQEQSEALLLFKHNLSSFNYPSDDCGSINHPIMMSWNTSTDCCNWDGVTCDHSTGDVIRLNLQCGMLQGTIHPDSSLFNLTHLTHLYLSGNSLNGTLPSWLFTSPSLQYLFLDYNMFSGNVPFESFTSPSLKGLDLRYNNQLGGQIDVQTFPQLTNLTYLYLSNNNFSGELELDSLLSTLTNLDTLDLSYSGFSATTNNANHYVNPRFSELYLASCKLKVFPNSLRAMKQLVRLDLSSNEIHGQIPHWAGEIGGDLRYLYLQSNLIEGPFPPSICNMSSLMYLDMSNNRFGGSIPQCFGNITSSLRMIDMGNNSFQGTIPNAYGDCGFLEGLILNGNQLRGEVPSSWSKCQSLKVVDFGNNHLNGTFPGWLGALPNLQALVLKSNNFHGHIQPSSTVDSPFPSLRVLDLSHNRFVGPLPAKYFQNFNSMKNVVKNSTTPEYLDMGGGNYYSFVVGVKGVDREIPRLFVGLIIIDLSNNYFERGIPEIIGNLSSLKVLNLSHNSLNGRIPNSLGKLSEIESLDLSWNQLTGNIPKSLAGIKGLEVLNLSQNHLVGRIPKGTQFNTFQENSFSGNLGLCGFPLPKNCSENAHKPQLEAEEHHEEESGFTWEVVILGYGCGTLLGLVMGSYMLSTRKVKWFNAIADAAESLVLKKRMRRHVYIGKRRHYERQYLISPHNFAWGIGKNWGCSGNLSSFSCKVKTSGKTSCGVRQKTSVRRDTRCNSKDDTLRRAPWF
ncbi:Leucine-rich repeat-containing protein [Artemisia annua]|uniref:Leucine-rich repeat-containing protein n=1 Tax=Artemisia annua TaxID=35608 RepID=A0A2U1L2X8_ARTAN|nr:Leucine-rich repeat-containing protein [Artemisia annua]